MSSTSPGNVKMTGMLGDVIRTTPGAAGTPAQAAASPARAPVKKRVRDSPSSQARVSALSVLGSITDTVRAGAVRGLRAITDSMERPRSDASSSGSDSGPPSPTEAVRAATVTPDGKRRRTTLTDAITRRSHADWRGARWDYTSAMRDRNLHRVGDTGPSLFSFPDGRLPGSDGPDGAQLAPQNEQTDPTPTRPGSAMSAASAPAVLSTPRSHAGPARGTPHAEGEPEDRGWVMTVHRDDSDPFAIQPAAPGDPMLTEPDRDSSTGDADELGDRFVRAVRDATALLSPHTVNSPDACGALLAFQAHLRALDPYGNFTSSPTAGDSAAREMRELRRTVEELAAAQRACADTLRALVTQQERPASSADAQAQVGCPSDAAMQPTGAQDTSRTGVPTPVHGARSPPAPAPKPTRAARAMATQAPAAPGVIPQSTPQAQAKPVGRHDGRRAVFHPAVPFGGRIPASSSPGEVKRLNMVSYLIRDDVNAALRDQAVASMSSEDPVQVTTVNWTERGNLCMLTCETSTSAHLLLHAEVAATAAQLGHGWKACRDLPVFRAVLQGVPTKRADGSLFTEEDILGDLRAHSTAFNTLSLADSAEPASWISRDDGRALRDTSSLAISFATAPDAARFVAMRRCLFVFGRPCEPDEYRPRERERVCRRCWNPMARHRERDHDCSERCRLCGKGHAEEEHTCHECDVLSRPCAHIPLKCVNCGAGHAADDNACPYRRRVRGTAPSAPPMSSQIERRAAVSPARAPASSGKKGKNKRVRVLDPHEPFPDDELPPTPTPHAAEPSPAPALTPSQTPSTSAGGVSLTDPARRERAGRRRKTGAGAGDAARPNPPPPAPPQECAPDVGQSVLAASEIGLGDAAAQELVESDARALEALIGTNLDAARAPAPADDAATPGPDNAGAATRRVAPPRASAAAAEADREARRRRAAHVLRRAFSFMKLHEAIAAIRTCSDDYASAVSWAVEEQAGRRKPGMQGKSQTSLQRLVSEMTAAAASDTPAAGTDSSPPPANE